MLHTLLPLELKAESPFFYFRNAPNGQPLHVINIPIHVECRYLRHVVASAAEAEVGGLFYNAQTTIPIRNCLILMNHPQPPTPIKTDNSTAQAFTYNNIAIKKAKSWDMRYYWLRDIEHQLHFKKKLETRNRPRRPKQCRLPHKTSFSNLSQGYQTQVCS